MNEPEWDAQEDMQAAVDFVEHENAELKALIQAYQARIHSLEVENKRLHQEWAICEGARSGEMPSDTVLDLVMKLKQEVRRQAFREAADWLYAESGGELSGWAAQIRKMAD